MSRTNTAEVDNVLLQEIKDRSGRIETRLTRLCLFLGLDPTRSKEQFTYDKQSGTVYATGFDVSLGDLLTFLRTRGISEFRIGVQGKTIIEGNLTE